MKRKFNKKQITFVLIAVCLMGLIGLGVSYSYYLASIRTSNEENKSTDISTLRITSVVMDMQGKISSNGAHHGHKMVKEVVVRGIGVENAKPANASIKITPDLGDFSSDVTWKLYKSDSAITCSSVEHTDGREYYDESTCNIPASASLVLEGSSDSDYLNIVVSPNTETKYYLVVEYANRSEKDQNNQIGKSFSIDIGLGEKTETLFTKKITDLAKVDTVNLASDDPDKNIRYIGKNPDNYVYFNCSDYNNQTADTCEKWRIIGLFNNITKGDGTKENLVKIINLKFSRKFNFSWDLKRTGVGSSTSEQGSSDWTDAQLMMVLNPVDYLKSGYTNSNDIIYDSNGQEIYSKMGSYYNGTKGCDTKRIASGASFSCTEVDFTSTGLKNDTTRNAIEEVIWNLGNINRYKESASMFYNEERGTSVYSGHSTTWVGKIALMYLSDYLYANANSKGTYLLVNDDGQYVLSQDIDYNYPKYFINSVGRFDDYEVNSIGTSPVLYLKSSFTVKDGDGSESNPYQLSVQ